MKIGDRVQILVPYSNLILGNDKGTVVKVKESSCIVKIDGIENQLLYKFNEIKKI